jgi:hypothetical protein
MRRFDGFICPPREVFFSLFLAYFVSFWSIVSLGCPPHAPEEGRQLSLFFRRYRGLQKVKVVKRLPCHKFFRETMRFLENIILNLLILIIFSTRLERGK